MRKWPYKTGGLFMKFNSYEIFYDRTRKRWLLKRGDHKGRFNCIVFHLLGEVEHPHGLDSKETAEVAELQLRLRDSLHVQVWLLLTHDKQMSYIWIGFWMCCTQCKSRLYDGESKAGEKGYSSSHIYYTKSLHFFRMFEYIPNLCTSYYRFVFSILMFWNCHFQQHFQQGLHI
jgi:hypothetical protein